MKKKIWYFNKKTLIFLFFYVHIQNRERIKHSCDDDHTWTLPPPGTWPALTSEPTLDSAFQFIDSWFAICWTKFKKKIKEQNNQKKLKIN